MSNHTEEELARYEQEAVNRCNQRIAAHQAEARLKATKATATKIAEATRHWTPGGIFESRISEIQDILMREREDSHSQ